MTILAISTYEVIEEAQILLSSSFNNVADDHKYSGVLLWNFNMKWRTPPVPRSHDHRYSARSTSKQYQRNIWRPRHAIETLSRRTSVEKIQDVVPRCTWVSRFDCYVANETSRVDPMIVMISCYFTLCRWPHGFPQSFWLKLSCSIR